MENYFNSWKKIKRHGCFRKKIERKYLELKACRYIKQIEENYNSRQALVLTKGKDIQEISLNSCLARQCHYSPPLTQFPPPLTRMF